MNITPIQLAKRVEKWQRALAYLGVGHVRIDRVTITDDMPQGSDANAAVWVANHYDRCTFFFRSEYLEEADARSLDETIVHEWVHVAMRDFDSALEVVEEWMPPGTFRDWSERVDHEREGFVERLAFLIVSKT